MTSTGRVPQDAGAARERTAPRLPAGAAAVWVPAALTLLTVVAAGIRLHDLGGRSLWIDEVFSIWVARQPFPELWRATVDLDAHPPLYYGLLHAWLLVVPDAFALPGTAGSAGEIAVRLPSVLFGVLTIPLTYLVGRRVGGRTAGLLAAGLMALSPLQVYYAQQARMYTMLTAFAAAATLCFLQVLDGHGEGSAPRATWWWSGLVATTALSMLSHNTGVLLPLSFGVYLLAVQALPSSTTRPRSIGTGTVFTGPRGALTALVASGVLWLAWLPSFAAQVRRVDAEFWLSLPTPTAVLDHWGDLAGAFLPVGPLRTAAMTGSLVLALLGLARVRHTHRGGVLMALLLILPPIIELLVSLRRPVFFTQTLVWTCMPFSVLVACGLTALRPRPLAALVAAGAAVVGAQGIADVYHYAGKEDWRAASGYLADRAEPGQLVLFSAGWAQLPFDHYYGRRDDPDRSARPDVQRRGLPADLFSRGVLEPKMASADLVRLEDLLAAESSVWVVYSHDWYTDPTGIVPRYLDESWRQVEVHGVTGVRMVHYRRSTGSPQPTQR